MLRPPTVLHWPAAFDTAQNLLIVAVNTKNTPIRESARLAVRRILRDILGDVELISVPGQPLRLARQDNPSGLSISHENGLSLLAIHRAGPVGIDLLRPPESSHWQTEIPALANDYLGPKRAGQIAALPPNEQLTHFAQAWTEHEARLKCRKLGLEEWSAALEAHLAPCRVQALDLPAGYLGAVATLTAAENPTA